MTQLDFLFKAEKNKILEKLKYYGIKELPYLLSMSGKEKVRGYTGNLSTNEIILLNQGVRIELIGLYLLHLYPEDLRLSFDAISALKNQITQNIIELDEKQGEEFLKGRDIALTDKDKEKFKNELSGFKIVKLGDDLIGNCKLTHDRIINYMPKERRLR